MSIECLNDALKIEGLSPTKKFIMVILANYADEDGACYPSYGHIAKIVGLKDGRNVRRIIKEFEDAGWLRIEHRITSGGGQTSNRYHLTLSKPPVGADTPLPPVLETLPPRAETPSNTKEDTKDNTYTDDFKTWWAVYPRKVGKHMAAQAYKKSLKDIDAAKLLQATKNFAESHKATEERSVPHAQTWLNGKRFLDSQAIKKTTMNHLAG